MLSLRRPSDEILRREIAAQAKLPFTYHAVGATASNPPTGYVLDHARVRLGSGEAIFRAAAEALRNWEQFQLGWVAAEPRETPLAAGSVIAVVARAFGVWSVNFARIVYTVDDQVGRVRRFGFAYGTLPDHIEAGEERFLIEWDTVDGSVHYDILAFSRPRHLLAKLGYPLIRRWQRRFGRDSAAAVLRIVRAHEAAALEQQ